MKSAVLIVLCLVLTSCSALSSIRRAAIPPAATATAGTTTVTQKGEAQTPATASAATTRRSLTLPAGSVVWQDASTGEIRYRLGNDTPITTEVRTEHVNAPAAFTPPKPPTVAEEAEAKADFWTRLGLQAGIFVGGAAGIFGLVRAWPMVMWGGVAVCGACLFGLFVKNHPALLIVIGLGVALKFVGPLLWHTKVKHFTKPEPTAP